MEKATLPDVLTLEETSIYLRLSIEEVTDQAVRGDLPGRKVKNGWRFLKIAIDDWLRTKSSRSVLLHQAGAFADDESLTQLRDTIYEARERTEVDQVLGD